MCMMGGAALALEVEALYLLPELWKVNPRCLFWRGAFCLRASCYLIETRKVLGEAFDLRLKRCVRALR